MCGICAFIGDNNQIEQVVQGLKKLEYRGYDSSGIAFFNNNKLSMEKCVGTIANIEENIVEKKSKLAIGHTRWATHGKVSVENAHPHFSSQGNFAIVHNGIIENFKEIKQQLNVNLKSETDTEVFVNLIEKQSGDTLQKILNATQKVIGSFAFAILDEQQEKVFVGKRNSPLYVAIGKNGCAAASDLSVFDESFEECFSLDDNEFVVLEKNKIVFYDKNRRKINKNSLNIKNYGLNEEKIDEKYFMLKEINEQPYILKKTIYKYFNDNILTEEIIKKIKKFKSFHFVACGTAYHSALHGAKFIQEIYGKSASVSIASEFRYEKPILRKSCLYIFVSQSGETADTIASAKLVKNAGMSIMCVTNVPHCSLNNLADFVVPTFAGKEIAVASTKAYTAQIFTLLIFAAKLACVDIHQTIMNFVLNFELIRISNDLLEKIIRFKKIYFMGRGQDYITSMEAALKLKEIAYINCLGIAAGELKHGTLALVDSETLVVAISTQKSLKEKIESNIEEVKARGGSVLLVSNLEHDVETEFSVHLQDFEDILMPIASIVPMQFLAFEYAKTLGYNPDKPRNLAKSVTVE